MTRSWIFFLLSFVLLSCGPDHKALFDALDRELQQDSLNKPLFFAFQQNSFYTKDQIVIPEMKKVNDFHSILKERKAKMEIINLSKLDQVSNVKYKLTNIALKKALKGLDTLEVHRTNPRAYTPLPFLENLVQKNDPKIITAGMVNIGTLLDTGIKNLSKPASDKMEAALNDAILTYELLDTEMSEYISGIENDQDRKVLLAVLKETMLRTKDFIGFCNSQLIENGDQELFGK